jgi:hypothetical protein
VGLAGSLTLPIRKEMVRLGFIDPPCSFTLSLCVHERTVYIYPVYCRNILSVSHVWRHDASCVLHMAEHRVLVFQSLVDMHGKECYTYLCATRWYCQKFHQKVAQRFSKDGPEQAQIGGREERRVKMRIFIFFVPDSHQSVGTEANPGWVGDGVEKCFRWGWAASLPGRRRTQCTSEGTRRSRPPQMDILKHAVDRPRDKGPVTRLLKNQNSTMRNF